MPLSFTRKCNRAWVAVSLSHGNTDNDFTSLREFNGITDQVGQDLP